ncbi:MAG: iron complex outermembrane recepter [Chitinophagaceae bacterium]|nr:MAG: iron complex outermembrane recepter [Chitinophagaceae bacterium]
MGLIKIKFMKQHLKLFLLILGILFFEKNMDAQVKTLSDTITSKTLDSITVNGFIHSSIGLPEELGTYLYSGKKTELIQLSIMNADISAKTGRQVFAKVPGVFVYDMDGAGNQINIATRGLDPHRGWEFNIRKDGIITNSDMYGYPASHYSMPLESIEKIELVRGTGSLQYGAQFGGMLNYISKKPDTLKRFGFETINTTGSYNLFSTYNAVSGTIKKFSYHAYLNYKTRDGYRNEEHTNAHAQRIVLNYALSKQFNIQVEWPRSAYTYKIPGALNDSMFSKNPKQATRARNYFNPDIHIPAITIHWNVNKQTELQFTSSAVLGKRNSVLFDKPVNINDTINANTGQYNHRQVDIDQFNSYTTELRVLHHYYLGKRWSTVAAGLQYMNNDLHRTQLGKGTTGTDYDLSLVDPIWGRDIHFKTKNIAVFAENKIELNKRFVITTGARLELGHTDMSGVINYYPTNKIPLTISHQFPLFAAGLQYKLNNQVQFYSGWSQSYRPMIFKDLVPGSLYETVDPTIKDASGYNAELGFKGNWQFLKWDITAFVLRENNRFGTLAITDANNNLITYRTNTGNSFNKGVELFVQADWQLNPKTLVSIFTSTAFMNARYVDASVKVGSVNRSINNNKVESAPDFTTRNGVTVKNKLMSTSLLYSFVSSTFADPLNTVIPSVATGAVGLVPAYGIVDLNFTVHIRKQTEWKLNINNLLNKSYFTKRPLFYPGPGIWPSDGINFTTSISFKL